LIARITARAAFFALGLALVLGVLGVPRAMAKHQAATPEQKVLEEAIGKYLRDHPEVIIESLQIWQERQKLAKRDRARELVSAHRAAIYEDPKAPVLGNPDGDVTIVEFFDYRCPYCKRVRPLVMKIVEEDPGVRVIFKEFPILGPDSVVAARAAIASLDQDPEKYFPFHDALMESRAQLTKSRILDMAREVGLDADKLEADMKAAEVDAVILRNRQLGQALGLTGTPSFIIGGEIVRGAIDMETLRALVARARES